MAGFLVGAVPQPLSLHAYDEGSKDIAPSKILKVTPGGAIDVLFQDPGDYLSAATVAVRAQNKILIGARGEDKFLMCSEK